MIGGFHLAFLRSRADRSRLGQRAVLALGKRRDSSKIRSLEIYKHQFVNSPSANLREEMLPQTSSDVEAYYVHSCSSPRISKLVLGQGNVAGVVLFNSSGRYAAPLTSSNRIV